MASYDDLRNVIKHIADKTGDPNAWQQGLTPQQIRDVNGWLASDGAGYKGYKDPETGVVYEDRSHQNSSVNPAVPDDALDRIRQSHYQLFDPATRAPISPAPGAPSANTPAAPDINSPQNTDPGLNNPPRPGAPPPPAPPGGGLSTDEENSGRTADAIKKVQGEMADRQSNVREADAKLAEIMLSAHAKSAEGRAAIQGLQQDIIAALNDPKNNLDTKDGELQFLKFLREKAEAAKKLVLDDKLTDADQAKMALALADFYKTGSGNNSDNPKPGTPAPGTDPGAPAPSDPGLAPSDPGLLGPSPEMPDPMMGDLGLPPEGTSPFSDALGAAAPLLSGMGNPLGGGLPGGGLDLGAITKPIGDAISAAADHPKDEPKPDEKADKSDTDKDEEKPGDKKPGEEGPDGKKPGDPNQPPQPGQPAPAPAPGSVPDPAVAPPAPPAPSLNVDLKDGSQVTAADPSRAGATRSLLTGTQYGEALRQNGLVAPPPGTTLTNYLPPNQLQPADYAMYQDKLVGVLGPDKFVGADGRIEPLNTLPQDGFLGFGRPTAAAGTVTPASAAPPPAPAPVAPPTPLAAPPPAPPPFPSQGPK